MYVLKKKEIARIVRAHKPCRGNLSEAARRLHHKRKTIRKYWREEGLPIGTRGVAYTEADISVMVEAHTTYHGNASEASKYLPYCTATIIKYWREEGLPIANTGPKGNAKDISKIIEAHETYQGNLTRASKNTEYS